MPASVPGPRLGVSGIPPISGGKRELCRTNETLKAGEEGQ
jgi:hypothetical protein